MGCFWFHKDRNRHSLKTEDEAELVLKSLELMRSSQKVSVFPGLRWIHAPTSTRPLHRHTLSIPLAGRNPWEGGGKNTMRRSCESLPKWEPLYVLVEKGTFKGTPLPLPPPPKELEDDCLVPPLVPRTNVSSLPVSPDIWGVKLKYFRFEELYSACQEFSSGCCIREGVFGKVYKCLMHIRDGRHIGKRKIEVAVFRLRDSIQDLETWITKVKWIARMQNPNVCKLIGFCASAQHKDRQLERLLVFEHCDYGGLNVLLSKSQYIRPLDWSTRVNIALGAARGLAYLHERAYFQVVYTDLTPASVLIDKDFNAKLSDYGLGLDRPKALDSSKWDECIKRDVADFGLVLLELLVGSKNMKRLLARNDGSTRWIPRLLREESKLQEMVDSELRSEPELLNSMRRLAAVALKCLRKESHLRPGMDQVVTLLEPLHSLEGRVKTWETHLNK
ncbi:probable serine/threonine-protein kinase PBL11 isoform X1 [Selaginella moellendorffii]|uniref:probable serine/threonine-protein kinase PBL11 isoform X1 n=2 Tax=Selaginella moellendorffii TaxID=88036 RepID=UPI000D1C3127|nr:probable serine/threonine-protein kinase PBL11 isoform X1 [Selaginella moellendorffii]|eukprot:XP_024535466.1 probable serine/threonine-protein kinase PBL11 isoform X1 [Selaginella moellendorffii]